MPRPKIFISYSHYDEREKETLMKYLRVLQLAELAEPWNDDRIRAGGNWYQEIQTAMGEAKIAILLITVDFLASEFIQKEEVPKLLARRQQEGLVIFPIVAHDCPWRRYTWLQQLQLKPKNAVPVWRDGGLHVAAELTAITEEIAEIIEAEEARAVMLAEARMAVSGEHWAEAGQVLERLRREAPQFESATVKALLDEAQEALQRERAEQARIAREKEEAERQARERAQREEQERLAAAQAAQAAAERAEQERREHDQAEKERLARERAKQGLILTLAPDVTLEFVRVPAGEFLMGSDKAKDKDASDDEVPQHKVKLDAYLIGKYPVTVAQFAAFVNATGYKFKLRQDVLNKANHPVTHVRWNDARSFCEWASQVAQSKIGLPSEAQWEKAARGADGRIYPWSDEPPTDKHCNFNMNVKDTTPVGQYSPRGDSPYGCADMAGNVWEWTSSLFKPYPYRTDDGREDLSASGARVLRGGAWNAPRRYYRSATRVRDNPMSFPDDLGFRVARSPAVRPA